MRVKRCQWLLESFIFKNGSSQFTQPSNARQKSGRNSKGKRDSFFSFFARDCTLYSHSYNGIETPSFDDLAPCSIRMSLTSRLWLAITFFSLNFKRRNTLSFSRSTFLINWNFNFKLKMINQSTDFWRTAKSSQITLYRGFVILFLVPALRLDNKYHSKFRSLGVAYVLIKKILHLTSTCLVTGHYRLSDYKYYYEKKILFFSQPPIFKTFFYFRCRNQI